MHGPCTDGCVRDLGASDNRSIILTAASISRLSHSRLISTWCSEWKSKQTLKLQHDYIKRNEIAKVPVQTWWSVPLQNRFPCCHYDQIYERYLYCPERCQSNTPTALTSVGEFAKLSQQTTWATDSSDIFLSYGPGYISFWTYILKVSFSQILTLISTFILYSILSFHLESCHGTGQ